jgi:AmiR/NasT family two-component response regulator
VTAWELIKTACQAQRAGCCNVNTRARVTVDQVRTGMQTRSVIEQAKGVLMERHGYSDYTVFKALCTLSQRSNQKQRDVAAAIVQSTCSPL